MDRNDNSWRRGVGVGLILGFILIWALLIAFFAPAISRWPILVQAPFYLFMGIAWIIPLKPLLQWMETGSFRPPRG
jgi:hypothetical protein